MTGRLIAFPLALPKVITLEKKYWIGRKRSAMAMARAATSAEARLIHYELAGRYSIKAAYSLPMPAPQAAPARPVLHLAAPAPQEPSGDPTAAAGTRR